MVSVSHSRDLWLMDYCTPGVRFLEKLHNAVMVQGNGHSAGSGAHLLSYPSVKWGLQCPPCRFLGGSNGAMYIGVPSAHCPTHVDI